MPTVFPSLGEALRLAEKSVLGLEPDDASVASNEIAARIQQLSRDSDMRVYQFKVQSDWEGLVVIALLRRYGLVPFRFKRQKRGTVMARVSERFMNDVLWPIHNQVVSALRDHFNQFVTAMLPDIADGPYSLRVLDHDHANGELCEQCLERHLS
jgi:hypothetical protein